MTTTTLTLLGIPLQMAQAPIAAANALLWAQTNGVGADLLAIQDAYETVDRERWEKLGAQLLFFKNGFARDGSIHPQAHNAQMEMVKIIQETPLSDWQKILQEMERKNRWAFQGGFFATTQDVVGQVRSILALTPSSRAEEFDKDAGALLGVAKFRRGDIFSYNSDWLPTIKTAVESLRIAKASFINGHAGCARFHLLLGAAKTGYLARLALCALARKFDLSITPSNWIHWYNRGFELIDALIQEQKYHVEKVKTEGPIQLQHAFDLRELKALNQFREFYEKLLFGTQHRKNIRAQTDTFFRNTKKEWALELFFAPLFAQLTLPDHPLMRN